MEPRVNAKDLAQKTHDVSPSGASIVDREQGGSLDLSTARIQGSVRRVPRAKLCAKRQESDGTFTEVWMFVARNIDQLVSIKRDILEGTDIPARKTMSANGGQSFTMEQYGDLVWMTITGLPN